MRNLGAMELGIILLIVVMTFGVRKLPEVGAGLGKGVRGFRQALAGSDEQPPAVRAEDKETVAR